jgi:hypothetical protein
MLAKLGYAIFPILPGTKLPAIPWKDNSTCNEEIIASWWREYPDDNAGINCGESSLLVVDVDSEDAMRALKRLWKSESTGLPWDDAPTVATRRGWHLYFSQPRQPLGNSVSKLALGVDTRGAGGMVVAPGSVVKGVTYQLVSGDLSAVPLLPAWLEVKLRPKLRPRREHRYVPGWYAELELGLWEGKIISAPDGEQNNTINRAAYSLAMDRLPDDVIETRLGAAAEQGHHPRYRAAETIRSGIRAAEREEDD